VIQAVDLFSGAGGLTLGFKAAGVETICAVESIPARVETFSRHSPRAEIKCTDIRRIDLAAYRGRIDIVYGGPPCQPFSSGGLRLAKADERDMVPSFIEALRAIQPAAFLMENVPGLMVGDRLPYLFAVLREMDALGYQINHRVLNAADYGVPQRRRRLFVVGMKEQRFRFPDSSHGPLGRLPHVTVDDVLPRCQIGRPNPSKVFYAKAPDLRPSPYDGHVFNGGGRPIDRCRPCHTILASAGGNKTHFFDDLDLVPEYHRLLMAGDPPRAGSLPGARRLTVEESAILQTFPAEMKFCGPISSQYHQVGDAVPPKLAEVLARTIVEQLGEPTSQSGEPAGRKVQGVLWP